MLPTWWWTLTYSLHGAESWAANWFAASPLPTHSTVQSPSWAANWFAASQEIPRNSRNPKVHYRTHKRPPPVSILGQPNPVHRPTSHLLENHPNITHPSTPRSPQLSLSLRYPRPYALPSPHPYAPHAQPISFFSILSPARYWVKSTNYLAPRMMNPKGQNMKHFIKVKKRQKQHLYRPEQTLKVPRG